MTNITVKNTIKCNKITMKYNKIYKKLASFNSCKSLFRNFLLKSIPIAHTYTYTLHTYNTGLSSAPHTMLCRTRTKKGRVIMQWRFS